MRQIYPQRLTPIGPHNPVWKIPTSEKLETPTPLPRPQLATPARQRSVQWKLSSAIEANHYWSNKKTLNLLVIRNKRQIFCLIESFWRRNLSCVVESSLVILNIDLLGLVWRKREIFEGFLASLSWPKDALGGLLENFVLSVFCFCSFDFFFFFTLKFTPIVVLFWNWNLSCVWFGFNLWLPWLWVMFKIYGFNFLLIFKISGFSFWFGFMFKNSRFTFIYLFIFFGDNRQNYINVKE